MFAVALVAHDAKKAEMLALAENRWKRLQNDFYYRPTILPSLLRSIFDEAKEDGTVPKFEIVKEAVAKVEPKTRIKKEPVIKVIKERIKLTAEQKRLKRIQYETQNADKIKAKRKDHYERNHERLLEEKRAYHKANAEKIIAQKKQYRLEHKDQISQMKKEYYQRKKLEKIKEYRDKTRERINQKQRERYAKKKLAIQSVVL